MDINIQSINELKALALDSIENAKSGHPGIVFSSAEILYTLFAKHFKFNPQDTDWHNRDRFVMSAGHGSALLYSIMHLCGYDISINDLKKFRSFGSKTPGHPEITTSGIDCATGPLGQGVANAVGMAIAETMLASKFNKTIDLVDHYTYCLVGDGCLMEGVALESISLAGHYQLNKLILLYDKNNVTLDEKLSKSNTEDVSKKFLACNFNVLEVKNGHDIKQINEALIKAKCSKKPTIIIFDTTIARESVVENSNVSHGKPLGEVEVSRLKKLWGLKDELFYISKEVKNHFNNVIKTKILNYDDELKKEEAYQIYDKTLYEKYHAFINGNFDTSLQISNENEPTRDSSATLVNEVAINNENFVCASADVSSSTKLYLTDEGDYSIKNRSGRNIFMGVREHAMAGICNGIALHGGLKVACSCFFAFSDYMRASIRMAALMKLPVIYVFTHDSLAAGYDGATHQPIEHLDSMRLIPNITVFRPCDANECLAGWRVALTNNIPTALILTRQSVNAQNSSVNGATKGGYILSEKENAVATIIATGSEVELAVKVQQKLIESNIMVDVVSLPCTELFDIQIEKYKKSVIKNKCVIGIEASTGAVLQRYTQKYENIYRVTVFGDSGSGQDVMNKHGFNVDNLTKFCLNIIKKADI